MKKYYGKNIWNDTLYLCTIYDDDAFDENWRLDDDKLKHEFTTGSKFDNERIRGFIDTNDFEDMNSFIIYSEIFNIYQLGKI